MYIILYYVLVKFFSLQFFSKMGIQMQYVKKFLSKIYKEGSKLNFEMSHIK